MHTHTCIRTHAQTHTQRHIHTYHGTHTQMHIHTHACTHMKTHIHTQSLFLTFISLTTPNFMAPSPFTHPHTFTHFRTCLVQLILTLCVHSHPTLCEGGGRGEMGGRETEQRGGKIRKKRRERRKKDEGERKKKGEERSGGWSDSRVHVRPSPFHDRMVSPHT